MRTEYFVLTQDVKNPFPDRRSKSFNAREVFPKGSYIVVRHREADPRLGGVELKDFSAFGGSSLTREQGEAIEPYLEKSPRTIGQLLDEHGVSAEGLLTMLAEFNMLSPVTISDAIASIGNRSDEEYEALLRKHWLHR